MITKTFSGVRASVDLTIADVSVDYDSIVNMEYQVDENMHDYARIEMAGIPTRAVSDYHGAPVKFIVGSGSRYVHEFHGTVEVISPTSKTKDGLLNGSPFQQAILHCYGASYRMRGPRNMVWEGQSLFEVASTMADRHGFSLDCPQTKHVYPRLVQDAESDWAALVRYSGMFGLRVNVHGTHMHIYDPQTALSRSRSLHRLPTLTQTGPVSSPGKVSSFEASLGRTSSDGVYEEATVTVMPELGDPFDMSSSEVLGTVRNRNATTRRLNAVVDSVGEAESMLRAEAVADYDYSATVQCLGVAGVYPGGVVDLDRYNSSVDHLWYVKSVTHNVNSSAFYSTLELRRNVSSPLASTMTTPYKKPPLPAFKNGRWETSKKKMVNYA